MIIKWYGQTTFLLQDSTGRRILIDPFDSASCDSLIDLNPSIITVSHNSNSLKKIYTDKYKILQDPIIFNLDYISINGYSSYHDNFNGSKRGLNTIFTYVFDNMKLCHLGHLGHILSDDLINTLGHIDILFIPIGGHFALSASTAVELAKKMNPTYIIPMNYKTLTSSNFLYGSKEFIVHMKNATKLATNIIDTDSLEPTSSPAVLLIDETFII